LAKFSTSPAGWAEVRSIASFIVALTPAHAFDAQPLSFQKPLKVFTKA
jgi:hypothetical protein